eukprot:3388628-Amphidinium_carterae.1
MALHTESSTGSSASNTDCNCDLTSRNSVYHELDIQGPYSALKATMLLAYTSRRPAPDSAAFTSFHCLWNVSFVKVDITCIPRVSHVMAALLLEASSQHKCKVG